jgi:DNA polymerase III subunit epsilon
MSPRFAVIDIEKANGNPSSICWIGIAEVHDEEIIKSSILLNPEEPFDSYNSKMLGLTDEDVKGKPLFPQFLEVVGPRLHGCTVYGHGPEDFKGISAACEKYEITSPSWSWKNSQTLAKHAWPGRQGYGLKRMADFLGLDLTGHHDPAIDADVTAQIILAAEQETGLDHLEIIGHAQRRSPKP